MKDRLDVQGFFMNLGQPDFETQKHRVERLAGSRGGRVDNFRSRYSGLGSKERPEVTGSFVNPGQRDKLSNGIVLV